MLKRALTALQALPPERRAEEAERLEDLARRFATLRDLIDEGRDDAKAGRVTDWDFEEFCRELEARRTS